MRGFWVIHMIAFGSHLSAFTDFSQIYDLVEKFVVLVLAIERTGLPLPKLPKSLIWLKNKVINCLLSILLIFFWRR